MRTAARLLLGVFSTAATTSAQHYQFSNTPAPDSHHILSVFRFFAYAPADPPPLSWHGRPIGLSSEQDLYAIGAEYLPRLFPAGGDGSLPVFDAVGPPASMTNFGSEESDTYPLFSSVSAAANDATAPTAIPAKGHFRRRLSWLGPESVAYQVRSVKSSVLGTNKSPVDRLASAESKSEWSAPSSQSVIIFDALQLTDADGSISNTAGSIPGIQLAVLAEEDFHIFVDAAKASDAKLCCTSVEIQEGLCSPSEQGIMLFPPGVVSPLTVLPLSNKPISALSPNIRETGSYVLLFANCAEEGTTSTIRVNGSVYLRNYFGYLPGVEAPKVSLYLLATIGYTVLGIAWLLQSYRFRTQLISLHRYISVVLGIGLLEALLWFSFFRHWNRTPRRSELYVASLIVISVLKNILSFMLVLVTCMGLGTTIPSLPRAVKWEIAVMVGLYTMLDSARQLMAQFRLAYQLPLIVVALCLFPISLLHAVIFFWIFNSLAQLMDKLKSTRQFQKLAVFARFYRTLVGTLLVAIVVLTAQILAISQSSNAWRIEWVFCDAAPVAFYLAVLMTVMWLWRPNRQSKTMAYSQELPTGDEEKATAADLELAEMEATYAAMGFSNKARNAAAFESADEHISSNGKILNSTF